MHRSSLGTPIKDDVSEEKIKATTDTFHRDRARGVITGPPVPVSSSATERVDSLLPHPLPSPPLSSSCFTKISHPAATTSSSSRLPFMSSIEVSSPAASTPATPSHFTVVIRIRPSLPREVEEHQERQNSSFIDPDPSSISFSNIFQLSGDEYPTAITIHHAVDTDVKNPLEMVFYPRNTFVLDRVFDGNTDQATLYEACGREVVRSVLQGVNGTLLAYGQTGTGKTYTMEGFTSARERGVLPRAVEEVFRGIEDTKRREKESEEAENDEENKDDFRNHHHAWNGGTKPSLSFSSSTSHPTRTTFRVTVSYLQIYNEVLSDLLKEEDPPVSSLSTTSASSWCRPTALGEEGGNRSGGRDREGGSRSKQRRGARSVEPSSFPSTTTRPLRIRHTPQEGVIVDGLTEWAVQNEEEVYTLLERGTGRRITSPTQMSPYSSRSHAIFMLKVEGRTTTRNMASNTTAAGARASFSIATPSTTTTTTTTTRNSHATDLPVECITTTHTIGKLSLVDLAGSEKIREAGVCGARLEETKHIHRSLHALGNVIAALVEQQHRASPCTSSSPPSSSSWVFLSSPTARGVSEGKGNALPHSHSRSPTTAPTSSFSSAAAPLPHIPFRNSVLTSVLRDSLGGNCRTVLIACVSPTIYAYSESFSTLSFAQRARYVRNHAVPTTTTTFSSSLPSDRWDPLAVGSPSHAAFSGIEDPMSTTTTTTTLSPTLTRPRTPGPTRPLGVCATEHDAHLLWACIQRCQQVEKENAILTAALKQEVYDKAILKEEIRHLVEALRLAKHLPERGSEKEEGRVWWRKHKPDDARGVETNDHASRSIPWREREEEKLIEERQQEGSMMEEAKHSSSEEENVSRRSDGSQESTEKEKKHMDQEGTQKKEAKDTPEEGQTGTKSVEKKSEANPWEELAHCKSLIQHQRDVLLTFTTRLESQEALLSSLLEEWKEMEPPHSNAMETPAITAERKEKSPPAVDVVPHLRSQWDTPKNETTGEDEATHWDWTKHTETVYPSRTLHTSLFSWWTTTTAFRWHYLAPFLERRSCVVATQRQRVRDFTLQPRRWWRGGERSLMPRGEQGTTSAGGPRFVAYQRQKKFLPEVEVYRERSAPHTEEVGSGLEKCSSSSRCVSTTGFALEWQERWDWSRTVRHLQRRVDLFCHAPFCAPPTGWLGSGGRPSEGVGVMGLLMREKEETGNTMLEALDACEEAILSMVRLQTEEAMEDEDKEATRMEKPPPVGPDSKDDPSGKIPPSSSSCSSPKEEEVVATGGGGNRFPLALGSSSASSAAMATTRSHPIGTSVLPTTTPTRVEEKECQAGEVSTSIAVWQATLDQYERDRKALKTILQRKLLRGVNTLLKEVEAVFLAPPHVDPSLSEVEDASFKWITSGSLSPASWSSVLLHWIGALRSVKAVLERTLAALMEEPTAVNT